MIIHPRTLLTLAEVEVLIKAATSLIETCREKISEKKYIPGERAAIEEDFRLIDLLQLAISKLEQRESNMRSQHRGHGKPSDKGDKMGNMNDIAEAIARAIKARKNKEPQLVRRYHVQTGQCQLDMHEGEEDQLLVTFNFSMDPMCFTIHLSPESEDDVEMVRYMKENG